MTSIIYKNQIHRLKIFYMLLIFFSFTIFLTSNAFAENVAVGTWELHDFKLLYIFPDGSISQITSVSGSNSYDIFYSAEKDTVLEILLPIEIFQNDIFEYYYENNFEFTDLTLGISEDKKIISFIFPISKGSGHVTVYNVKDDYLNPYSNIEDFFETHEKNKEIFVNDIFDRTQFDENSKKAYEITTEIEDFLIDDPENYEEVLQMFDDSFNADPNFSNSWYGKLYVLFELGDYEQALVEIEKRDELFGHESYLEKGIVYLFLENDDLAVQFLSKAVTNYPSYDQLSYVVSYLVQFGLENEAKNIILDTLKDRSDYDRGLVLQEFGFYEDSLPYFDASIDSNTDYYWSFAEKSNSLFYLGKYEESIENADIAISIDPLEAYGYVLKADSLQQLGLFEESIKNYNTAIVIFPDYDYAIGELGNAYLNIGNLELSLQNYEYAIELDPEYDYYHQSKAWVLLQMEEFDLAHDSILRAIEIDPTNDYNHATKALILLNLGDLESSQNSVDTALQINSDNEFAYVVNGLIDIENENYSDALKNFEKSLEIYPYDENTQQLKNEMLSKINSAIPETQKDNSSQGGGCLIATATYGSEMSSQVQQLRELRDNQLLSTESGTNFMNTFNDIYYSFSPVIADYERENPVFREMVRVAITPMITSLSLMEYAETESEVLGIGISLIVLNLAMYVGIPVLAVMRIRR